MDYKRVGQSAVLSIFFGQSVLLKRSLAQPVYQIVRRGRNDENKVVSEH